MDRYIDLHTHSNYSDGTDSPEILIRKAMKSGLQAIALTDHDTPAGLEEFITCGIAYGIETVAGIEISTQMRDIEVHILGYYPDFSSRYMRTYLNSQEESRAEQKRKILEKLREIGIDITENDFSGSQGIITRGSIAGIMHRKGFVSNKQEAFDKYIGDGKPAFFDRERIGVGDAVRLILDCRGIPVIAHPYQYKIGNDEFESEIMRLADIGLRGIEIMYPDSYTVEREAFCRHLAEKYSLLTTGGSDYHGDNKTIELGYAFNGTRIPYDLLENLKQSRGEGG